MKKKKNQTSVMNRYLLIGLSVFCIFMMLLSSFSDKVGGPFKVVANVTRTMRITKKLLRM